MPVVSVSLATWQSHLRPILTRFALGRCLAQKWILNLLSGTESFGSDDLDLLIGAIGAPGWFDLIKSVDTDRKKYLRSYLDSAISSIDAYSDLEIGTELSDFPVSTRSVVSNGPDKWINKNTRFASTQQKLIYETSGTTGVPLQITRTPTAVFDLTEGFLYQMYTNLFHRDELDSRHEMLVAMLTRKKHRLVRTRKSILFNGAISRLYPFRSNLKLSISIFKELIEFNPAIIHTDGVTLDELIEISRYSYSGDQCRLSPKIIFISGHGLYRDELDRVQKHFNSTILEAYATTELGIVAFRVNDERYTVRPTHICEVISEDGSISASGKGELVVTSLLNEAMPLIRYRTGDRVELFNGGEHSKDVNFHLIDRTSISIAFNGKMLNHLIFDCAFSKLPIRRYKISIISKSKLLVAFEPIFYANTSTLKSIIADIVREIVGEGIEISCVRKSVIDDNEKYYRIADFR
jgi:phenylacetate-coenzyme A ligase PaaK-like adenylate-forming protein